MKALGIFAGRCILAAVFIMLHVLSTAHLQSQIRKSHRESFGNSRATLMESLLESVSPGARIKWDPDPQVEDSHGSFSRVQFPGLTYQTAGNGTLLGATGIELSNEKEQAIFNAKQFRGQRGKPLPTTLVVFRTDSQGKIAKSRRLELDPAEPLSEIEIIRLSEDPKSDWPSVQIQYVAHIQSADSYTQLEWRSVFDSNAGKLTSRLPIGIVTTSAKGGEQMHMFSIRRLNPSQLEITDVLTKTVKAYACTDPCVVDGPTLLAQWSHQ